MGFYGNLKQVSHQLIKQFGQPCLVRLSQQGKYNPTTGEYHAEQIEQKGDCLFDRLAFDFSDRSSSVGVKQGDVLIYLACPQAPVLNAEILVDDEIWIVVNVQPIKPAGTTLLYQCQARKRG